MRVRVAMFVGALAACVSAQTPPGGAPFKPGATTEPGWVWECEWQHDVSTVQVYNLGCAGSVPKTQKNEGPHASAEACEKWCCETMVRMLTALHIVLLTALHIDMLTTTLLCCAAYTAKHLKLGPQGDGGSEATRTTVASDPPCDFWQWADMKAGPNLGCWVAASDFSTSHTEGAKPDWIGAQGCTRPFANWGVMFIVAFLGCGSAYLLGGAAYMRTTKQQGWLVHRHFWDELGGLVEDGMAFSRGERGGYGRVKPHSPRQGQKKKKSSSKGRFAGGRGVGEY